MGLFGKSRGLVGLDIGSNAIKAVEIKPGKGGKYEVITLGIEPLAPEAIVDGTILDAAVVIDTITKLFQENRIKGKDVATSVSGNAVIVKKITLPSMTEDELAESIQWEAEQYIPFDIEDVNIDYQILGQSAENMDVLLVAAKKDKINDYTSVISQAGLNPVVVDVDAFAMQGAYEANYDVPADEVVALVNIGASIMNINILRGGSSVFWRDISSGGNKYTEEIQKEMHLSQEQAERLKTGQAVEGVPAQNARPVIEQVTQEIATEIQKTFDFFIATSNAERINRIVLGGGTSRIAALETALSERFGARVEVLNPFERVEAGGKGVNADLVADSASQFAVAVGLATRAISDGRINLLRERRSPGAKKSVAAMPREGLQPLHVAMVGLMVLAVGYVGFDYWQLNNQRTSLVRKKGDLERELQKLADVLKRKEHLQKQKELLDRKITVIKELKSQQGRAVRLLDELSKALPDYVWFRTVGEEKDSLRLDGFALNANKVAELIGRLLTSGRFNVLEGPDYAVSKQGQVSFRLTTQFKYETEPVAGAPAEGGTPTAQTGGN